MNIYKQQILSQGKEPSNKVTKVADLGEFPKTIYGRTFDTKEEYLNALHDFLNSNWHHIMNIKTTEICDGLTTLCLTDDEGNEYVYLNDIEEDTISPLKDYSQFGTNGLRLITENNEYEIEWS